MTVSVAWIRTISHCQEMIFVSDSRLSGDGTYFDSCPKIMLLPRGDCVISFSGYTGQAYPMMLQLSLAIESYAPLKRGSMELDAVLTHLVKILNSMSSSIKPSMREPVSIDAEFIFGGYSWTKKKFELWNIIYNKKVCKFQQRPAKTIRAFPSLNKVAYSVNAKERSDSVVIGEIAFGGDQGGTAKSRLLDKYNELTTSLSEEERSSLKLGMEPFEVVRDMLRDNNKSDTIGGPPQMVKVYQYMRSAPLAVYWPNKSTGIPYLLGRPCLGYEYIDYWGFDPDTLRSDSDTQYNTKD